MTATTATTTSPETCMYSRPARSSPSGSASVPAASGSAGRVPAATGSGRNAGAALGSTENPSSSRRSGWLIPALDRRPGSGRAARPRSTKRSAQRADIAAMTTAMDAAGSERQHADQSARPPHRPRSSLHRGARLRCRRCGRAWRAPSPGRSGAQDPAIDKITKSGTRIPASPSAPVVAVTSRKAVAVPAIDEGDRQDVLRISPTEQHGVDLAHDHQARWSSGRTRGRTGSVVSPYWFCSTKEEPET